MGFASTTLCVFAVPAVLLMLTPARSEAELVRVEIAKRTDVLNGKPFGKIGPYEKLWGKADRKSVV